MKKFLFGLVSGIILILLVVLFYNYFSVKSQEFDESIDKTDVSAIQGAERRFAESLTFPTVSYDDTTMIDYHAFELFHEFLRENYPLVFNTLDVEVINDYSLLLHWPGSNPDLLPGVLMAHQDVVPVSDDTRDLWAFNPFGGIVQDDTLYGRGAVDDKINLIGQLEAVEFLLESGFTPQRDLYFSYGQDEEISGRNGAVAIAKLMDSRNIRAEFVLDEGGFVSETTVQGLDKPLALISTSEKGYLNLELSVNQEGGHSSMPNPENAIDVLSKALVDLSKHPFPAEIIPSQKEFLLNIAPHSGFVNRLALSNMWLFSPLVKKTLAKDPQANSTLRTSMVPTIINAGVKENVVPNIATVNINYRLLPGTSIDGAVEHTPAKRLIIRRLRLP